ncbi:MAG TPA: hypothetical protein VEF53_01040, partial [Patescibacteria group bacterium]|nr:hypothetical protein [Patescibacteria group bacterium]
EKLIEAISCFNTKKWLDKNHSNFVKLYGELTDKNFSERLTKEEVLELELVKSILDSLDKQLNVELENTIFLKSKMAEKKYNKLEKWEDEINELDLQINTLLEDLKRSE